MDRSETAQDRIAFLRGLRNPRQFRPEPIPREVVDDLLEVARWTGSSMNRQPWEFVVVQDRATLQQLGALDGYVKHLANAPLAIVLVLAGDVGHLVDEAYDEGRLTERLMLAAHAYGIGASIGWFAGDGPRTVKQILRIPEERLVRSAISFGYPDEEARRAGAKRGSARKPLSAIVHWEHYSK